MTDIYSEIVGMIHAKRTGEKIPLGVRSREHADDIPDIPPDRLDVFPVSGRLRRRG
jgi:hypothetical protein